MNTEKVSLGRRVQTYVITVLNGMALGLFSSLIIGLILQQIGVYSGIAGIE